jgi:hypothetical protein
MPMTDDVFDLPAVDRVALELSVDLTLADVPPDPGRPEQIQNFLQGRPWLDVALFCSYHQQMTRLSLHPGQSPPCWIETAAAAEVILAVGPSPASDGSSEDVSNCGSARLLKLMIEHGVSPYHPNPLRAIAEAKKRAAKASNAG